MAMQKVFAIYDVKAELYGVPFFMPARGQAIRAFMDLVNDGQSQISRYPGDFKLVQIGTFDDLSGALEASAVVETLGFGSDFKAIAATPIGVAKER